MASVPLLFGFHPDNSLVILGIGHSSAGGRYIRHGVRIDLDQIRGRERAAALELAARLRDHDADIAILVAFGPRGATGAKARPDHCRKLMAAFRAQIEAAPTEERVTVVDALYTCNGRWWSYMCRNTRCCPPTGTVVPAEAPPALTTALTTRGHTVYPSREALDATLAPYPPHILARTAAAAEPLDPTWYDTDPGLTAARQLMDALLLRCGEPSPTPTSAEATARSSTAASPTTSTSPTAAATTSAARTVRRGLAATATVTDACASTADSVAPRRARTSAAESSRAARRRVTAAVATSTAPPDTSASNADSAASRRSRSSAAEAPRSASRSVTSAVAVAATSTTPNACSSTPDSVAPGRSRTSAAESARPARRSITAALASPTAPRGHSSHADSPGDVPSAASSSAAPRPRTAAAESPRRTATTTASLDAAAIPAARSSRRRNQIPTPDSTADPALDPDAPQISDAEVAQLLIALLNWRVRDYLACAAATEESAGRLLRLCTELARRAPHPELRLAPYSLAAWAAWAIGRPSIAQCAVDRALAIDPEYKFASLIRAGLHHAIDGEGVRESAANTRRDLFGEAPADPDPRDPDHAPTPVPSQRSTEPVPTDTNLEVP